MDAAFKHCLVRCSRSNFRFSVVFLACQHEWEINFGNIDNEKKYLYLNLSGKARSGHLDDMTTKKGCNTIYIDVLTVNHVKKSKRRNENIFRSHFIGVWTILSKFGQNILQSSVYLCLKKKIKLNETKKGEHLLLLAHGFMIILIIIFVDSKWLNLFDYINSERSRREECFKWVKSRGKMLITNAWSL